MATRTNRPGARGRRTLVGTLLLLLSGAADGADAPAVPPPPVPPPVQPAPAANPDLPRETIDLGDGVSFESVLVPAGDFDMGSPPTEEGHERDEVLHRVRITKPFWLARTEVTQAVWEAVMGDNPSDFKGVTRPAEKVSWSDAVAFVERLNARVSKGGFRLPTEAEWEYAGRAGSRTRFCSGDDEASLSGHAWYEANSDAETHSVGRLQPNAWGLFDMHGNVLEWCSDWVGPYTPAAEGALHDPSGPASGTMRAVRGGAWNGPARVARCANRSSWMPETPSRSVGFRLARTASLAASAPADPGAAPAPAPTPKPPSGEGRARAR